MFLTGARFFCCSLRVSSFSPPCGFSSLLAHFPRRRFGRMSLADPTKRRKSVAILIIGDEILNGRVVDTNGPFLFKHFLDNQKTCEIKRVVTLGDDLSEITEELRRCSARFDHVITTGGIGPTHDDLTYAAAAKAFDQPVIINPEIEQILRTFADARLPSNPTQSDIAKHSSWIRNSLKLALIPEHAELVWGSSIAPSDGSPPPKNTYPVVKVANVFIFPGTPIFLQKSFERVKEHFFGKSITTTNCPDSSNNNSYFDEDASGFSTVHLAIDEFSIASQLTALSERHPGLQLGSYPEMFNNYFKVAITVRGGDSKARQRCVDDISSTFGDWLVSDPRFFPDPTIDKALARFFDFSEDVHLSDSTKKNFETGFAVTSKCFEQFRPSGVVLAFTGGKDCTVTLHLAHLTMLQLFGPGYQSNMPLKCLSFVSEEEHVSVFPETTDFSAQTMLRYKAQLLKYTFPAHLSNHDGIKHALSRFKTDYPSVKAIIMGVRKTDPFSSHLSHNEATDEGWPSFMRVYPVLDWSYGDVWTFLRSLYIPYCPLYDRGYTSLGDRRFSKPNELLRDDTAAFKPAYKLQNQETEREFRIKENKL